MTMFKALALTIGLISIACHRYAPTLSPNQQVISILPRVIQIMEDESRTPKFRDLNSGMLRLDVREISDTLARVIGTGIDSAHLRQMLGRDFVNVDHRVVVSQPLKKAYPPAKDVSIMVGSISPTQNGIRVMGWSDIRKPGYSPDDPVIWVMEWTFEFVHRNGRWVLSSQKHVTYIT